MFKIAIQAAIGAGNHRPDHHFALCKGRDGKMLRRRHHPGSGNSGKQKKGKNRIEMIGNISIPQSAFLAVLKSDTD